MGDGLRDHTPLFLGSKIVKLSFRRGLAAVAAVGTVLAGSAVVTTAPAQAAQTITNYAFNGSAYGTFVSANPLGIKSGATAYSYLGCTRLTGVLRERSIASVNAPNEPSVLTVGAVDSVSRTYRMVGGRVGMRSNNRVAKVVLGDPNGLNITIAGLRTRSDAFATKDGKLHAESAFSSLDISAHLPEQLSPLEELLNTAGASINTLLAELMKAADNNIVIPGLGRIALGRTQNRVYSNFAVSNAISLRVKLFGPDGVEDAAPKDDVNLVIGRSRSRIAREVPSGVMFGHGHALDVKALDGVATLGPFGERPLPCEGTRGKIKENAVVGADLLNASVLGASAASGRVYGIQRSNGSIKAWTEGRIASVTLGAGDTSLKLTGIVARANAVLTANGTLYRSRAGSQILSITAGGESYPVPIPGQILEIPGVAKIQTFLTVRGKRTIAVTAVRVTLLPDSPGETVVNLGVAHVGVRRV
jgi:hypothetical protein